MVGIQQLLYSVTTRLCFCLWFVGWMDGWFVCQKGYEIVMDEFLCDRK